MTTSSSSCITFKAKIHSDPAQILRGIVLCHLTVEGLRLQQGEKLDLMLPIGTATQPRGSGRFSIRVADRDLELTIASWKLYPDRLARDLCQFLNGQRPALCRDDYVIPAYLFIPALLPLGIPLITLGGALPGALAVGLAGGNLAIARVERWPVLARLALALTLTGLGYAGVVVLLLVLPSLNKPTTIPAAPATQSESTTANSGPNEPFIQWHLFPPIEEPPLPVPPIELPLPDESREMLQMEFSKDGQTLVTMDRVGACRLWDVRGRKQRASFKLELGDRFGWFALSPDGKYLIAWDGHGQPCLRRLETVETVARLDMNDPTFQPSSDMRAYESDGDFSADGKLLAILRDRRLRFWTVPEGRPVYYPEVNPPKEVFLSHLRFGSKGKTLITAASTWQRGSLRRVDDVWDLDKREHVRRLEGFSRERHDNPLQRTLDRKLLVLRDNNLIEMLDWKSDRLALKLSSKDVFSFKSVALWPERWTLITGEENSYVRFWSFPSGRKRSHFTIPPGHFSTRFPLLAVSTDGMLATAEGRLLLWDLRKVLPPQ